VPQRSTNSSLFTQLSLFYPLHELSSLGSKLLLCSSDLPKPHQTCPNRNDTYRPQAVRETSFIALFFVNSHHCSRVLLIFGFDFFSCIKEGLVNNGYEHNTAVTAVTAVFFYDKLLSLYFIPGGVLYHFN
jgi:hypothetical protein